MSLGRRISRPKGEQRSRRCAASSFGNQSNGLSKNRIVFLSAGKGSRRYKCLGNSQKKAVSILSEIPFNWSILISQKIRRDITTWRLPPPSSISYWSEPGEGSGQEAELKRIGSMK
jgi:hypothetical protein